MKKKMIFLWIAIIIIALFLLFVIAINRIVIVGAGKIIEGNKDYSLDKRYDAIVVLGAGLRSDGKPSNMLEDRLKGAIELYKKGVADTLILSGDRSEDGYDEPASMKRFCLANGVSADDIILDGEGYSTYETMHNVVKRMGYKNIVVVTQKYHIYRAVFIARRMGAEADGFSTDYRSYIFMSQRMRDLREVMARIKDFFKVEFYA